MAQGKYKKASEACRLAGRFIGLVASVFILIFIIGETASDIGNDGWRVVSADGILLGILMLAALAGCTLSWWRERLATVILLLVSIGLGIHIAFYAGRNHFLAWMMVGFPFLFTAALLWLGLWLEKRGLEKGN